MININLSELSKIANVSKSTVSLVLNDKPGVNPQTRERVKKLLLSNGYKIRTDENSISTFGNLVLVKFIKNGFIVERNGDFISDLTDGIAYMSSSLGYDLIVKNTSKSDLSNTISYINSSSNIHGAIILGTECEEIDLLAMNKLSVPYVIVDNPCTNIPCNSVVMNNEEGAELAVNHLYNLGHRDIGLIKSSYYLSNFELREKGFYSAITSRNLTSNCVVTLTPTLTDSYKDMVCFLRNKPHLPTAFFAENDSLAIGAMKALKEYGYSIPNDISIVGFDNISSSSITDPPLSTINIYKKNIGYTAVKLLSQQIKYNDSPTSKILINSDLINRTSTNVFKRY